jgi:Tfp pilus assembly protein FimT
MRRSMWSALRAGGGFTMIEMVIVFVVVGIMTSIMVKSVRGSWLASSRRSASREVTAYLYRTRAIAVQQSRTASLVRSGDVLKIVVDSSGTPVQLGTTVNMSERYGATLSMIPADKDRVEFDPRGFVANVTQTPKLIIRIGTGTAADTLCVTGLGRITTRSCP